MTQVRVNSAARMICSLLCVQEALLSAIPIARIAVPGVSVAVSRIAVSRIAVPWVAVVPVVAVIPVLTGIPRGTSATWITGIPGSIRDHRRLTVHVRHLRPNLAQARNQDERQHADQQAILDQILTFRSTNKSTDQR